MEELEGFACDLARRAGALIRERWHRPRDVSRKSDVDLVTDCDRAAEELIVGAIERAYPDHEILAEESGHRARGKTGACWIIDPLDGTTNWVHGVPHLSVSIAVAEDGRARAGAVYDPLRDEMFHGRRGHGAWLGDERLRASATTLLDEALLATGFPYDRREHADFYLSFAAAFMRVARDIRRFGSAALDLCYVAGGRFDGFWEWGLKPWDVAAGSLLVEEAGGRVTDFAGAAEVVFGGRILASNGVLHAAMVEVVQDGLRKPAATSR